MGGFDKNQLLQGLLTAGGTAAGGLVGQPQLGGMAGGMAGQALFKDDQKHGMAQAPQQGATGAPALQILQAMQQQMQAQEQQRQQSLQALLMSFLQPQGMQQPAPGPGQSTTMESRHG